MNSGFKYFYIFTDKVITVLEGGVRGIGVVYISLVNNTGFISNLLMNVTEVVM